jgi:DNA-binding beta-propeller fold protein YncE
LTAAVVAGVAHAHMDPQDGPFRQVASFSVFLNTDANLETAAEIVAATDDGHVLLYVDGPTGNVGFVDILDPKSPRPAGVVTVGGEPTSVAVAGGHALVVINTSADFVNTSGQLKVIDLDARRVVRSIELDGQPDAIAVSPDRRYAAIAIENERDEDMGDGRPPQYPPGFVVIVDLVGPPSEWTTRRVDLVGVAELFPEDPEPEFIDINHDNVAAVTLQENNHIVLISLADGGIAGHFSAGTVNLKQVDVVADGVTELKGAAFNVPREPDGIVWTSTQGFVIANEGDLDGGGRGFSAFSDSGRLLFEAGNSVEHLVAGIGHYPEHRSEDQGNEPETVEVGAYGEGGRDRYLFVGSERSNIVVVYELTPAALAGDASPRAVQVLHAGVGPEGLLAIPQRGLFVIASEVDVPDAGIRSTITIYERGRKSAAP